MSFVVLQEGGKEFQFPCEQIMGRIDALHGEDEFQRHCREVKQAKASCAASNEKHFPTVNKTQNQNS